MIQHSSLSVLLGVGLNHNVVSRRKYPAAKHAINNGYLSRECKLEYLVKFATILISKDYFSFPRADKNMLNECRAVRIIIFETYPSNSALRAKLLLSFKIPGIVLKSNTQSNNTSYTRCCPTRWRMQIRGPHLRFFVDSDQPFHNSTQSLTH